MNDTTTARSLLDGQLRLLESRSRDVAALVTLPGEPRDEAPVDRLANDLVGARLVLRAPLATSPPAGVSEEERAELIEREREAGELLRAALAVLSELRR